MQPAFSRNTPLTNYMCVQNSVFQPRTRPAADTNSQQNYNYLKNLFGKDHNNVHVIFNNNPYVDEFVDEVSGEVFHDHYRIYDKDNTDVPLAKQILKFWQFNEVEMNDCQPEMYWSDEEKEFGDKIINRYVDGDFGFLLVSKRFGSQQEKE